MKINRTTFQLTKITNRRKAYAIAEQLEKENRLEFFLSTIDDTTLKTVYYIFYYNYR